MTLMMRVPLGMLGQAMFSDRFAILFLAVSVLTKVVVYTGIRTIDCYGACDVRGAHVGCLIFTLLVSVLGMDLRAFRWRDRHGVREGSISVESTSGDTRRGVGSEKYDRLGMTSGRKRENNEEVHVERGLRSMGD